VLERVLADPALVEDYRERARERARRYSWEAVTDQYEQLLQRACDMRGPGVLPPELIDAAS
jgi:glycosyltransferase involved in cell wall biosynthesis